MTEQWHGSYAFGSTYPKSLHGLSFAFIIDWTVIGNRLEGTCQDADTKNFFDSPATINGSREGAQVRFIKTYPLFWEVDRQGIAYVDYTRPSAPVNYRGRQDGDYMEGSWRIAETYINPEGGVEQSRGTGTWMMHRIL